MLRKHAGVLCVTLIMSVSFMVGCMNLETGRDFDLTKAQTFQKGKTSRADIIAAMGEPSSTGSASDGSFIEYQYQKIHSGPGALVGAPNIDERMKLCRFMFDAASRLKDYTCSQGTPNYSGFGK